MRNLHDDARARHDARTDTTSSLLVSIAALLAAAPDELLDVIADRIADRLVKRTGGGCPRYADSTANPFGSARAFADAARRAEFPTFLCARRVTALWSDVEAAIERRKRPPRKRKASAVPRVNDDRALLEAAGVRLGAANDSPPISTPRRRAGGSR